MPKRVERVYKEPRKVKESWVDGYEKAFWKFYAQQCGVPEEDESIYGWEDYRASQAFHDHMKQCTVDRVQTQMPQDCSWEEFAGTFTDNDLIHGLWAVVTCDCGKYRKQRTKYRGTLSELILGVVSGANVGGEEAGDS